MSDTPWGGVTTQRKIELSKKMCNYNLFESRNPTNPSVFMYISIYIEPSSRHISGTQIETQYL